MEGRPPSEAELVERARLGDVHAYGEIVRRHQELAFRAAYLVARDAADAEDAVQESFVKAYRALGRFRRGAPFRPWLLRIVVNEARNRRRSSARRSALAVRAAAEAETRAASTPSPEAALVGAEERVRLLRAVEELREEERLVVACRYFLDLSEAETAAALAVRRGTVKSRLSRALARLRAALEEEEPVRA